MDAVNGDLHLGANPECTKQVASADLMVITKRDLSPEIEVRTLEARLQKINPAAKILHPEDDPNVLFGGEITARKTSEVSAPAHSDGTDSVSLTFDGPVDWASFGVWLSMLLHTRGEEVLRVKGMLDVGDAGPVVLSGVQHIIHPPDHLDEWPDGDRRSRLVFITRGVDTGEILTSLRAFSGLLGASPVPLQTVGISEVDPKQ